MNINKTSSSSSSSSPPSSSSSSSSPISTQILNNNYSHLNQNNFNEQDLKYVQATLSSTSSSHFPLDNNNNNNTFQAPAPPPSTSSASTLSKPYNLKTQTKQPQTHSSFDSSNHQQQQIPLYSNQITSTTPSSSSSSFLNHLANIKVESNFYLPSSSSPTNANNNNNNEISLNNKHKNKSFQITANVTKHKSNSLKRKKSSQNSHHHHHHHHHNQNQHTNSLKLFKAEKCDICSSTVSNCGDETTTTTKAIPCESCKIFFRRYSTSKKFTNSSKHQQCYCTSTANSICSSCRFEKCIRLAGMKRPQPISLPPPPTILPTTTPISTALVPSLSTSLQQTQQNTSSGVGSNIGIEILNNFKKGLFFKKQKIRDHDHQFQRGECK